MQEGSADLCCPRARRPGPVASSAFLAILVAMLIAPLSRCAFAAGEHDGPRLGLCAGMPQTLAVTAELRIAGPLYLQGHAGSVVLFSSVGARALLTPPRWRLQPYVFGGGGFFHAMPTDTGEGSGGTGFGWWGAGARLRVGRLIPFAEMGRVDGFSEAKGYPRAQGSAAVGILWAF